MSYHWILNYRKGSLSLNFMCLSWILCLTWSFLVCSRIICLVGHSAGICLGRLGARTASPRKYVVLHAFVSNGIGNHGSMPIAFNRFSGVSSLWLWQGNIMSWHATESFHGPFDKIHNQPPKHHISSYKVVVSIATKTYTTDSQHLNQS